MDPYNTFDHRKRAQDTLAWATERVTKDRSNTRDQTRTVKQSSEALRGRPGTPRNTP